MLKSNKLLLALLLPVFILALCYVAIAEDIIVGDQHFTPEQWAAKQAALKTTSVNVPAQQTQPGARASRLILPPSDNPSVAKLSGKPIAPAHPNNAIGMAKTNLVAADFNDGVFPPTGWTVQTLGASTTTWSLYTSTTVIPYEGAYCMVCGYDSYAHQDNWFISPTMNLTTGGSPWQLQFAWTTGYYWMVSPNDNADVYVKVSTDGGATWSTPLWDENSQGVFPDYVGSGNWAMATIALTPYLTSTDFKVAFQYLGKPMDADGFFLDYISVNDGELPEGRCCFGDPAAPSCTDETQAACTAEPGYLSWQPGMTCAANPCPVAGLGDDCTNPVLVNLPADYVGSVYTNTNYTCGRGDDYTGGSTCLGYYDGGEDIIYKLTVTSTIYVDVTVDPKGTTWAGFSISEVCPPTSCIAYATNSSYGTPFTIGNLVLAPGTYYIMVDTYPTPDCIDDFDLIITDKGTPPVAPPNDLCANAQTITVPSTGIAGTTIGATVDCPGMLDWKGVWYVFELPYACNNLTIDFNPSLDPLYTVGVVLMNDCLCTGYTLYSSIDWGANSRPIIYWNNLPAGTYYFPAFAAIDASDSPMDFIFDISAVECPEAPPNDLCVNATPLTGPFPQTVSGSTVGATIDCPGVLDWNAVWYSFEVPSIWAGANVTIDYCSTIPELVTVGVVVFQDCSCGAYILHSATDWATCNDDFDMDGYSNPTSVWMNLPPGTYYYPAFTGPGTYGGQMQDFTMHINMEEAIAQPGDNCLNPLEINIPNLGALPYTDNNYTCGRVNDYANTCMSYYDGGEDIIYKVEIGSTMNLKFTLDPLGTDYTGMALGLSCPPPGATYTDCFAQANNSGTNPYSFNATIPAGTYYLMIDTWPAPDCIPAFDLTIEEFVIQEGDNCFNPIKVNLPTDAPYLDANQYTCGRVDDYNATCMNYYDGGEDIVYEVNVDEAGYYQFWIDPKGTTYTGMGLGLACPPPGAAYTDCVAYAVNSGSAPHGFMPFLTPGTYYLMIDTWPSPACILDFDLTINLMAPPLLTWDKTMIEFCNVQPGGSGGTTLNLCNLGDVPLTYSIMVQYGLPPVKNIAGSNVACQNPYYIAGQTADFKFRGLNNSSDAEWLDTISITFPTGVTVNTANNFRVVTTPTRYLQYNGAIGNGVKVTWWNWNGGDGNIYGHEYCSTTVNLSFNSALSGPLTFNYYMGAYNYGSAPHEVSGTMVVPQYDPLTNWLSVAPLSGTILGGKACAPIAVNYGTIGLAPGTYFASLVITHNGGLSPITIPITMTIGPDHTPSAVIMIDRSGSMALTDVTLQSRLTRAKALANTDADALVASGSQVAVMSFNSDGIVLLQDFTTVADDLHAAINSVVDPRHDTPLAAAMCQAHCDLYALGCGSDAIYTYTDGLENYSTEFDMCYICDICYRYVGTGWNYDCDPTNPATCSEWQLCLADLFAANGVTIVNYFGSPINPFGKGGAVPEDLYILKYMAEKSGGDFNYFADATYICGDANGDRATNVSDAVYIINYVFAGGVPPQPMIAGNANCDQLVNVSDAVYIINYVFVAGSPAPCACDQ